MAVENKGKCIIIVPVYKEHLSPDEVASFIQLRKILGENYDVALVCPKSLEVKEYLDIWKAEKDLPLIVDRYDDKNFVSWLAYGKFMTLPEIYKNYRKNYEYMLVYQLDGWVFRDELQYWCDKGYDYIGGLEFDVPNMMYNRLFYNGGVSLRKISAMLKYIKKNDDEFLRDRYWDDRYFSRNYNNVLNTAPGYEAVLFCLDQFPSQFYNETRKIPCFAHAWKRYNYDFWKPLINPSKNLVEGVKNKTIQIFGFCHKQTSNPYISDYYHTRVAVGSALQDNDWWKNDGIETILDNNGDNISDKNPYWRELTGIYYLWKNVHDIKYIGTEHYRRKFDVSIEKVLAGLESGEIDIVVHSANLGDTIEETYKTFHSEHDFKVMEEVVKEMHPDYAETFDKFLKQNKTILASNCFITSKDTFDKMWEFVFPIIEEILKRMGVFSLEDAKNHAKEFAKEHAPYGNWIDYQAAFPGFMAERLTTIWILKNCKNIKVAEYKKEDYA